LHYRLDGVCALLLDELGKRLAGYVSGHRPTTSDKYSWFYGLQFDAGVTGVVLITIPWSQDWDKADGTQAERSIAVYLKSDATVEHAVAVLQGLVTELEQMSAVVF
jgi:hypothetical protein